MKDMEQRIHQKINHLHFESDKILSGLSYEDKAYVMSYAKPLVFKKGKLIFYEGGIPTGIFMMKSGRAKIYKTGEYGKDQIFYIYTKNDLFGYHALLANEKYEDACEVLEDSEVLFIKKDDFEYLMEKIQRLKLFFIQNMSHEFGVLVNIITILAQKNLRERLALNLLILHERYYNDVTGIAEIKLPREDLANIIGTARESLGRLIKEFREDGWIEVDKRTIRIVDHRKLLQIANI